MGRTALLKQTSEQRCREAFDIKFASAMPLELTHPSMDTLTAVRWGWDVCWKYLESRLIEEIQA